MSLVDPFTSFDAMLTEAFDPVGETSLCRVSGEVWTLTGLDDWDPFLVEHTYASGQTVRVVSVERVLTWAASWVPGSTTPQR